MLTNSVTRCFLLTGEPSATFRSLNTTLSPRVSRTGNASNWYVVLETLYK